MADPDDTLAVGVLGVGSMGAQHARVYDELPATRLVGVADADPDRAATVAGRHGVAAMPRAELLAAVDAVSVAAPDRYHDELAGAAIDAGVHVLVEKPFVVDPADGEALIERADDAGLVLQVGHVERFNPVVRTLSDVLADTEVIAVAADRLGPPVARDVDDNVVRDLMIHDIDVVRSLLGADVRTVQAIHAGEDPHVTALCSFDDGTTARLTASRVTQKKVRQLVVTTPDARVEADYLAGTVEIHRRSVPEYVAEGGDVRYRHEGVVERPAVGSEEPLREELAAFAEAVRTGSTPAVTGEDGLAALSVATRIDAALGRPTAVPGVSR